jgi:hypothetical protein
VGNREVYVNSFIDTAAECQTQARRLLAYQCEPDYLKMNQVSFNTEAMYRQHYADTPTYAKLYMMYLATGMPGDVVAARNAGSADFGNDHDIAADWPAHAPEGGALYNTLQPLWQPTLTYDATSTVALHHTVRAITRVFTPQGGWDVTLQLVPRNFTDFGSDVRGATVDEYDSGSY